MGSREKISNMIPSEDLDTNMHSTPRVPHYRQVQDNTDHFFQGISQGLVLPCAGWRIDNRFLEKQQIRGKYSLEEEANYSFVYRDLFFPHRNYGPSLYPNHKSWPFALDHANFIGFDPELGPVAISILKEKDIYDGSYLYLLRNDQVRLIMRSPAKQQISNQALQSTIVSRIPAECYGRRASKSAALLSALRKLAYPNLEYSRLVEVKVNRFYAYLSTSAHYASGRGM